jgi:hypothetical protein
MALIRNLVRKDHEHSRVHDAIEATYTCFENNGGVLLQIDSYGRDAREIQGKTSQTVQFDRDGAFALYNILKREFKFE